MFTGLFSYCPALLMVSFALTFSLSLTLSLSHALFLSLNYNHFLNIFHMSPQFMYKQKRSNHVINYHTPYTITNGWYILCAQLKTFALRTTHTLLFISFYTLSQFFNAASYIISIERRLVQKYKLSLWKKNVQESNCFIQRQLSRVHVQIQTSSVFSSMYKLENT